MTKKEREVIIQYGRFSKKKVIIEQCFYLKSLMNLSEAWLGVASGRPSRPAPAGGRREMRFHKSKKKLNEMRK